MSVVGQFPGISDSRRLIRQPVNDLDKCTIISIYPKDIKEEVKHTIEPGRFKLPSGRYENPGRLVVGPSSWWREIDEYQPILEIPVSSLQVANSVINDYMNGLLECDVSAGPGLFYVIGEIQIDLTDAKLKKLIDDAKARQDRWYYRLVQMADILWARTQGNPLSICDDMRLAAQEIGLKDKPWLKDFNTLEMIACRACGALRNPLFPVCQACNRIVDIELAKKLGIIEATKQ